MHVESCWRSWHDFSSTWLAGTCVRRETEESRAEGQNRVSVQGRRSEFLSPRRSAQACDAGTWVSTMSDTSIRSDEEAVKAWLRDYSGELLSVGIELGLTPTQLQRLQDRLLSIQQGFEEVTAIKANFRSALVPPQPKNDPMMRRWRNEHRYKQSEQRERV